MIEVVSTRESKNFIRQFLWVSLIWFILGIVVNAAPSGQIVAFIQIFLFSFLDIIFLILLFWNLFFTDPALKAQRINKIRIMIFVFFKLVCLMFLAITLKRLRNASILALFMGVAIICIGPLAAAVMSKSSLKFRK